MKDEYSQMIDDNRAIISHVQRCKNPEWYERERAAIDAKIDRLQRERGQLDDYHQNADRIIAERFARIEELAQLRAQYLATDKLQRLLKLQAQLNDAGSDDGSYVATALAAIGDIPDADDHACVVTLLEQCERDGWELEDAVRYARLTEHVNPDLPEEEALELMQPIAAKYR